MTSSVQEESLGQEGKQRPSITPFLPPSLLLLPLFCISFSICCYPIPVRSWEARDLLGRVWWMIWRLQEVGSGKASLDCSQIQPASQDCK